MTKYPTCFTTVDIAVFNPETAQILLGRKASQDKFRFIGGFSDPKNDTFESDAVRELQEETSLSVEPKDLEYLGSFKIDDIRYRGTEDCIKTLFYIVDYFFTAGEPKAADDIAEVKWFDVNELLDNPDLVVPEHQPLMVALTKYFRN